MADRDLAAELDDLAAQLRAVRSVLTTTERAELEARLGTGSEARMLGLLLPGETGTDEVSRTLGNVLPVNQQTNMLLDPAFEGIGEVGQTLTTSEFRVGQALQSPNGDDSVGSWFALKTAGTAATCTFGSATTRLLQGANPFHSQAPIVSIVPSGSGTHEVRVRSAGVFYSENQTAPLPFFVGAVKIGNLRAGGGNTYTNVTSRTLTLEIYDEGAATVVATSSFDLSKLTDSPGNWYQIACSMSTPTHGHTYQLRIRVIVVTSGSGANIQYKLGEPQLQLALSPDPGPYTPAVSGWVPSFLAALQHSSTDPVVVASQHGSGSAGDVGFRFMLAAGGYMAWGNGSGDAIDEMDVGLMRESAGVLAVTDGFGGDGVLSVPGGIAQLNAPTTYTPALGGFGTATFTFNTGYYVQIGRLVFVSVEILINSAGSGGGALTVGVPVTADSYNALQHLPLTHFGGTFDGVGHAVIGATGDYDIAGRLYVANSALSRSNLSNGSRISFNGVYFAA